MIRVRHYTRVSAMRKIMLDMRIIAHDQNRVFVERANRRPKSPKDAEGHWFIAPGKGNACVEFDLEPEVLERKVNPLLGRIELFVTGDVDLTGRNPHGFENT